MVNTIDCRQWQPTWFIAKSTVIAAITYPAAVGGKGGDRDHTDRFRDRETTRVATGLITSLSRPGGNLTGVSLVERGAGAEAVGAAA